MLIEFIHPKTGVVRSVDEENHNKITILTRAGFVLKSTYRPPKRDQKKAPPTASEIVEEHKQAIGAQETSKVAELAIHVSAAARRLIEENDLEASEIQGTGKDGLITKPDVEKYLKGFEPEIVDPPVDDEPPQEAPPAIEEEGQVDRAPEVESPAEAAQDGPESPEADSGE